MYTLTVRITSRYNIAHCHASHTLVVFIYYISIFFFFFLNIIYFLPHGKSFAYHIYIYKTSQYVYSCHYSNGVSADGLGEEWWCIVPEATYVSEVVHAGSFIFLPFSFAHHQPLLHKPNTHTHTHTVVCCSLPFQFRLVCSRLVHFFRRRLSFLYSTYIFALRCRERVARSITFCAG